MRILSFFFLLLSWAQTPPGYAASTPQIRILFPNTPYSLASQREITALVENYNRIHPETSVSLIRRGDEYSSLKELIAMNLAGDLPDLVLIETGELAAAAPLELAKRFPPPFRLNSSLLPVAPEDRALATPFLRTVPVLFADEETLFRLNVKSLPTTWPKLLELTRTLSKAASESAEKKDTYSFALPLQGPRGLWMFEALSGKPLWRREAGGLRSNRELIAAIQELQKLIDQPTLARTEENLDRAVQAFVDRRAPLLAASLDLLPYLTEHASFRWTAAPLPQITSAASDRATASGLEGGMNLLLTRDRPEVRKLIEYLYLPEIAARWTHSLGGIPVRAEITKTEEWKRLTSARTPPLLSQLKTTSHRSTDVDVVRARSAWIQALHTLFGEPARRTAPEEAFFQLDRTLSQK